MQKFNSPTTLADPDDSNNSNDSNEREPLDLAKSSAEEARMILASLLETAEKLFGGEACYGHVLTAAVKFAVNRIEDVEQQIGRIWDAERVTAAAIAAARAGGR